MCTAGAIPTTVSAPGLSDTELGLRLRYEIRRELAPYVGLSWTRLYGGTKDLAPALGGNGWNRHRTVIEKWRDRIAAESQGAHAGLVMYAEQIVPLGQGSRSSSFGACEQRFAAIEEHSAPAVGCRIEEDAEARRFAARKLFARIQLQTRVERKGLLVRQPLLRIGKR
jgi:Copper resistance protein B precursor (CopB)